jgi:aryl-alcohol dehydrogenase-like predicted oxidoreductase
METIGQAHQASPGQVALAWLLNDPVITSPIIGPGTLAQWEDNKGALDVKLSSKEMDELNAATRWQESEDE